VLFLIVSTVSKLPFELYSTFVLEEKHGFNKQTLRLYFVDQLKYFVLAVVITIPIVCALIWLINWGGSYFYIYAWLFTLVVTLFLMTIYPNVIEPWFNTFKPLEEGELKSRIYDLAKQVKFPLTKLFVVDGSKRSSHSNAYFYGFFNNKRIVLYDTLLEQVKEITGVLAILAHEIGHWKLNHVLKQLVLGQLQILTFFYLFGQMINSENMYTSFGFSEKPSVFFGIVIIFYVIPTFGDCFTFNLKCSIKTF